MSVEKEKPPSELKIALDNRSFEIQLFWQRSNYFLVLMTALGIGTFSVKSLFFSPIMATFAALCSLFWYRTNLGSKFWQESWEIEVTELAQEFGIRSFIRSTPDAVSQVQRELFKDRIFRRRDFFKKWIYNQIVKKHSVTYNIIILSLVSTAVWSLVGVVFYVKLMDHFANLFGRCVICFGA
ncbi:hypothetical protein [Rhizorhabdus sp.]|uniref:RipA family octameric membrane protein n=1 Tax=Rhizorhabdus sp. TaxID=1968843 RepID=UPI0019CD476B|nr:hypothetical protein [Rhizorhabdus sp.]MBD3760869.1 hypothetical protein [Rhizorhabdus sp.]